MERRSAATSDCVLGYVHCKLRSNIGIKRFELCRQKGRHKEESEGLGDLTVGDPFRLGGFNIL